MTVTRSGPGLAPLTHGLAELNGIEGKVGWFETAHYPNGTPVAYVATIHEFGTEHIPARPFMRPAVADHGQEWLDELAKGAAAVATGSFSARVVLETVMLKAASDVGKAIDAVTSPALKPLTIKYRTNKSDKPLQDTYQMSNSVTGKVESAGS